MEPHRLDASSIENVDLIGNLAVQERVASWMKGTPFNLQGIPLKEVPWILAQQIAVFLVPLPSWMPDKDLDRLAAPSQRLWEVESAASTIDHRHEPIQKAATPEALDQKHTVRNLLPSERGTESTAPSISKVLQQQGKRSLLAWSWQENEEHEVALTIQSGRLHHAIAKRLDPTLQQVNLRSPGIVALPEPFLVWRLQPWLQERGHHNLRQIRRNLLLLLQQLAEEHRQYFHPPESYGQLFNALQAHTRGIEVCISYNASARFLSNKRKDINFDVHQLTIFDHLELPSFEELKDRLGSRVVITGKDVENNKAGQAQLQNSSACCLLLLYVDKSFNIAQDGCFSSDQAKELKSDFVSICEHLDCLFGPELVDKYPQLDLNKMQ